MRSGWSHSDDGERQIDVRLPTLDLPGRSILNRIDRSTVRPYYDPQSATAIAPRATRAFLRGDMRSLDADLFSVQQAFCKRPYRLAGLFLKSVQVYAPGTLEATLNVCKAVCPALHFPPKSTCGLVCRCQTRFKAVARCRTKDPERFAPSS